MPQRNILDMRDLAAKALQNGASWQGSTRILWDIRGVCQDPFTTVYWGRPAPDIFWEKTVYLGRRGRPIPLEVTVITPCHKCEACLKKRVQLWTARARQEIANSVRTWFGTLTMEPQVAFEALTRARLMEAAQGVDFETLSDQERWQLWNAQIHPDLTKYIKRVRMEAIRKAGFRDQPGLKPFRYLLVTEAHKSGVPHFHMLMHENLPDIPVRKRTLDEQWTLGLIKQWRLVDNLAPASYVAAYLSKDARTRVRASQRYGMALSRTIYSLE